MDKQNNNDLSKYFAGFAVVLLPFAAYLFDVFDGGARGPWVFVTIAWLIYFLLTVGEESFYTRYGEQLVNPLFFVIQSGLLLFIGYLITPGILWVIGMVLIASARLRLKGVARWAVYGAVAMSAVLPYFTTLGLNDALAALTFTIPAIAFVDYFTQVTMAADKERERAETLTKELETANQKLGAYAVQAEEMATTQERNRIAREIHDNLGHYLTVVNMQLAAAKAIMPTNPEKAADAMTKAQTLTQEGLEAIRGSVSALREGPLGNRPIPEAIANLIKENEVSGINTHFTVTADPRDLSANATLTLYRVVQEALTNIRKYANASKVTVNLDYSNPETVQLSVKDNGQGAIDTTAGFGLLGIRERVGLLGGEMKIVTSPNNGFSLNVSIPN